MKRLLITWRLWRDAALAYTWRAAWRASGRIIAAELATEQERRVVISLSELVASIRDKRDRRGTP